MDKQIATNDERVIFEEITRLAQEVESLGQAWGFDHPQTAPSTMAELLATLASNAWSPMNAPRLRIEGGEGARRLEYTTSGGLGVVVESWYSSSDGYQTRISVSHPRGWHNGSTLAQALNGLGYR